MKREKMKVEWAEKGGARPEPVVGTDGRSLRATGRTAQLATRVKPETREKLMDAAARSGLTMAEIIERAVDDYVTRMDG